MSLRAILYARYSTDKQRETSIADQLRAALARVEREGWTVTATHTDERISGSVPVSMRPGGKALLADAMAGRFDVLVLEGLDRLSREMGEAEAMVKRLEYRGVRIVGTGDGYDSEQRGRKMMRQARGMVNEQYIDDLREKTHRGLAGQFDRGMSAGGRSYGYTTEEADRSRGRQMVIDEVQAAHVRWIFEQFAAGWSVQRITRDLNARQVPSPRGGSWAVSALYGCVAKGLGLLNNELYLGRVLWNRRKWLKDPDTGQRRYVERPQSDWQERDAPELRIISDELWQRTRARQIKYGRSGKGDSPTPNAAKRGRPARTLFGGLLRCHACGGPVIAVNARRYGCNVHKDKGPTACANSSTLAREIVDKRLLAEVRDELLAPGALAELQGAVKAVLSSMMRKAAAAGGDGGKKRLQELESEISRLVDAVASIGLSEALSKRLQAAEAERSQILATMQAAAPAAHALIIDDVTARYKRMLLQLQEVLEGEDRDRTRQILAEMIGPVTLVRGEDGIDYAEIEKPAERLFLQAVNGSLNVVAGAGFSIKRLIRLT